MAHLKDIFNKGIYPYEKQKEVIRFAYHHHYCIIGAEAGAGKSLMSVAVACLSGGRTLCVVPSSLKYNWEMEISKYCDKSIKVIETGSEANNYYGSEDFVIVSYSLVHHLPIETMKQFKNIISDESHYLNHLTAERTKAFHEMIDTYTPYRLMLLSGTPIKGRVTEFFSPIALTCYNPNKTSGEDISSWCDNQYKWNYTFSNEIIYKIGGRRVTKFEGAKNIDRLKEVLRNKYIRVKLSDIKELPPLVEKDVIVKFDEGSLAEAWEDFQERKAKSFMTKKASSAELKAPFTIEYANNLLNEAECVVVFTVHVKSAKLIAKGIKGSAIITGDTPVDERSRLVAKFQAGEIRCLVATVGAASTGFTLTRSSHLIFNDLSFTESDNEQARRRIYRIGQESKAMIHYILGGIVDKKIKNIIISKKAETEAVL